MQMKVVIRLLWTNQEDWFQYRTDVVIVRDLVTIFQLYFRVLKVAKKFKDAGKKVYFAVSNNNDFSQEVSEYGIEGRLGEKPVVVAKDSKDMKYIMETDFRWE